MIGDNEILWRPGQQEMTQSNLARFARAHGFDPGQYDTLHRWSTSQPGEFWDAVWDFCEVIGTRGATSLERSGEGVMFGARWYPDARLNYAENMLAGPGDRMAVIQADENGIYGRLTLDELRRLVAAAQAGMRAHGIGKGDRVAGILPNRIEALVGLLAAASLGAIWVACSPDFGAAGILDRAGQVNPKLIIACGSYRYNGKDFDCREKLSEIVRGTQGLETLVLTGDGPISLDAPGVDLIGWDAFCAHPSDGLRFEPLPFAHPLYVMFTSGTTGLPKGIVHTAGGVLLQHLKEHILHGDVRPGDVMSWYTNIAWMMYPWVISGLACRAQIVLYDGAPILKTDGGMDYGVLWRLSEAAGITHFGTSPRYLSAVAEAGYAPGRSNDLGALRSVLSAGAPVTPEQFDWLYSAVKQDMIFASISGGTEIIGCFALGSPLHPVRRGHLSCKALGLAVDVLDERNASIIGRKGDLVCTEPFPSAPLTFWGENGDQRYHDAYFAERPDIWTHGDLAEQTIHGSLIIYGRTDTTLKPGGVRIGTAEIYRVVETIETIQDSVVFGRKINDDEEIVLCVVLQPGHTLDDALKDRIRQAIRKHASPRHVPRHIHQVSGVPYTINGKRVEGAARASAAGKPVKNLASLANPACLDDYATISALHEEA